MSIIVWEKDGGGGTQTEQIRQVKNPAGGIRAGALRYRKIRGIIPRVNQRLGTLIDNIGMRVGQDNSFAKLNVKFDYRKKLDLAFSTD